ncbi:MAG: nucleotidyltransferase domain-containing protein [Candidatus Omnitrophica bacterium]|nr:nucleotidyltransferase domain-containing protein [Candidatus Omnitrophota bacterium]MCM8792910.1 nucleotidyltransferase domain-containing protein [Candidatus Omnitrophota bacterium]
MRNKIKSSVYYPLINRYMKELISQLKEEVLAITLFGSVARNTARKDSDIDILLLLSKKDKKIHDKIIEIDISSYDWEENQILRKKGYSTKIYDIEKTEGELRNNPLILLDILDHGIVLYDPYKKMRHLLHDFKNKLKELGTKKIVFSDGKWCWDLKPDWKPGEIVEIKL